MSDPIADSRIALSRGLSLLNLLILLPDRQLVIAAYQMANLAKLMTPATMQ